MTSRLIFDAATAGLPSEEDGLHMSPESHLALGKAMAQQVKELIG